MSKNDQSETPNEIIEQDKNIYSLSEINKSAAVVGSKNMSGDIFFPSNITYNSKEYVIKSILKEAFDESRLIKVIRFAPDSQLLIIKKRAFNNPRIERITIPSHVTHIKKRAFSDCSKLQIVEIPKDSELQIIDDDAFSNSAIEKIYLPIHLVKIGKKAFYQCSKLQTVEIAKNLRLLKSVN